MDEELKTKFHKKFMEEVERIARNPHSELTSAEWVFGFIPKFITDIYNVGKEVGELEGRIKGYDVGYEKGVKDEVERQKKALDELTKLN